MPRRPSPPTPCPGGWPAAPTSVTPAVRGTSADLPSRERRQLMPYAEGRTFYDADSHLMETSGWLASYADPGIRERLRAVAMVPLADPELAAAAVDEAIDIGCGAVLVPSAPSADISPSHPDYDGVWARLQDTGIPFMLHIGGGGRPLKPAFHNNGLPRPTDFLGAGENIRSKDYMVLHNPPETFLAVLVLDGVFERFPGLRGGCIEQGAMWVVPLLKRLDIAQRTFKRTEPALDLPLTASDYIRRQVKFTPFPTEPVGWMIEQAGDELFLFSSDYPHPEGGRNPLKRFEESLAGIGEEARERFYSRNFAEMMGMHVAA